MRLGIRSQGRDISPVLRGYIERRLRFVLGRFGTRIGQVMVTLADVDGPHGGISHRCRVVVSLSQSSRVCIEDEDMDVRAVVDRVTDRAGQSVRRELEWGREPEGRVTAWRGRRV